MRKRTLFVVFILLLLEYTSSVAKKSSYIEDFLYPNSEQKALIIWQWMDGLVTKEAITKDLEAFKAAGLSGVQNFQIGGDDQIRVGDSTCAIGSEKWKRLMRWTMDECERLGLSFGTHNCPGWSSSAYHNVTPEYSMQKIVMSKALGAFNKKRMCLPHAKVDAKYPFYKDISVLAVPNDSVVRKSDVVDVSSYFPKMEEGRWADTIIVGTHIFKKFPAWLRKGIIDGRWSLMRFGHTTNGKTNKAQAPYSGQGLECDKLNRKAVKHFWDGYPQMLINLAGHHAGKTFCRIEIDSYEAGGQDWSVVLPEEFMKRKGYDIMPWLPCIIGEKIIESKQASDKFKKDFVDVLTSLFAENYYGYMAELAEKSAPGMQLMVEPYGTGGQKPFQVLDIYKILKQTPNSLVATEFWVKPDWGWKDMKKHEAVMRNLQKPLLIAEAFTCWPLYAWQDDPQSLKSVCDRAFCTGVNRMMLHAGACNPWLNVEPGMSFGIWGTQFVPGQTWWKAGGAKALFDYMARCQSLLQRGVPSRQQFSQLKNLKTYRRTDGDTDIIFLCNPTDSVVEENIEIEELLAGRNVEMWNPYNLSMEKLKAEGINLVIEPFGSRFLILSNRELGNQSCDTLFALITDVDKREHAVSLEDGWDISFPKLTGIRNQRLSDWTMSQNDDIRYFSGTATYTRHFQVSRKLFAGNTLILDLGKVKNMASVRVNGKAFPVMWKAPFLLDITSAIKTGDNKIEIDVTNLWPNRMIGDEQEPDDIEWSEPLVYSYAPGKPVAGRYMSAIPDWLRKGTGRPSARRKTVGCFKFFTKDSPLLPSGLLGPVYIDRVSK